MAPSGHPEYSSSFKVLDGCLMGQSGFLEAPGGLLQGLSNLLDAPCGLLEDGKNLEGLHYGLKWLS